MAGSQGQTRSQVEKKPITRAVTRGRRVHPRLEIYNELMTAQQQGQLDRDGYVVLEQFMSDAFLLEVRSRVEQLFAEEGCHAGSEFKQEPQTRRLANLVGKGEVFIQTIAMPGILDFVRQVLGPEFKLGSLNMRSANPHSDWVQPLHADMGAVPDEKGYWVCNTVWMLDDFTNENGAIRMIPGTHKSGKLPQQVLADPMAPHPEEILLTGSAGTVVVMNAHMWHGGTANGTSAHRRAMHAFYCRWDKPQQQYQKKLLPLEVQSRLSPELRKLLAIDDSLNDELCATGANQSGFMK
jgi:ectoine hydroxylase-related dioxygenase (phytanoyl-CoA dioxygenase family)